MSKESTKEPSDIKVFIPKDYFKHAGYIRPETADSSTIEQRPQPRKPQIPFKERFNEKLEYPAPTAKGFKRLINNLNLTDQQSVSSRRVGEDSVSMLSKALSQAPTCKASEAGSID